MRACIYQLHLLLFSAVAPLAEINPVRVLLSELRTSLEEHQSALELIMTKYREQVFRLLMASKRDDPAIVSQLKEQHTTVSVVFIFIFCLLVFAIFLLQNLKKKFWCLIECFNIFHT